MRRMQNEMDRMMGGLWSGAEQGWSPAIEVSERDGSMVVCAELPGLDKDNVKVEATDAALIIEGERHREHEEKEEGYFRSERSYGSFRRMVPLPEYAKAEEARANFNNGVLEVTIPLAEHKSRRRKIDIGSGGQRKSGGGEGSASKEELRKAG
jgi:HSP20 family protein